MATIKLNNGTKRNSVLGQLVRVDPNNPKNFIAIDINTIDVIGTVAEIRQPGNPTTINLFNSPSKAQIESVLTGLITSHYHQRTYASLGIDAEPLYTADSVSVTDGTITSGTVVNTRIVDGSYLVVNESGKFDIQFTFSLDHHPAQCLFEGRYEGNPAHVVWLYIWNYTTGLWERVTSATNDFPSSSTDYSLQFILPNGSDYLSAGEGKLRIYHNSAAVGSHNMYIDYISIIGETLSLDVPGTYYPMTDFTLNAKSDDMVVDEVAGTITIPTDGDYEIQSTISFNGTANAKIELSLFINGVKNTTSWRRKMGTGGDVGSAANCAIRTLSADDILSWRFECNMADAYISIIAMRCVVIKASN